MERQRDEQDEILKKHPQSDPATRDEETPAEMPGGGAGYAGRGDTDSSSEASGGTEGYADRDKDDIKRR